MADTPFVQLIARVGELFLQWGFLEQAMRKSGRDPKNSETWMGDADLRQARSFRNLIAHGIIEASVDPNDEAHIVCLSLDGEKRRITLAELDDAIRLLESERFALGRQ